MIQLTLAEAELVLGPSPTHPHSALQPLPLKDGTYVLPEEVMFDPANADVKDFLAEHITPGAPTDEQNWDLGTVESPNEEEQALYDSMKLNWSEPSTVRMSEERQAAVGLEHGNEPDAETFDDDDDDEYKMPSDDSDDEEKPKPAAKKAKKKK